MPLRFRHTVLAAAFATAASLTAAIDARAASDYLLQISGIEGESTMKGYEKQIEIASFSWGVSQAATGSGGARAGKACPSDLALSKPVDKATPPLISNAVGGSVSPTAILIGLRGGGGSASPQPYIKMELKNVLVSSYSTSGSGGGGVAFDAFSLRFESAKVTYYQQDEKGQNAAVTSANITGGCN